MSSSSLAEALADRLLQRLPPDRAYGHAALEEAATAAAPGQAALPRTVRRFIERMMRRRVDVEEERLRVLRQPWLDYEHEDVQRAEEALLRAVRRHVRIPASTWERVVRHATAQVSAYLVRPVPTLEDFIFGGHSNAGRPDAGDAGTGGSEGARPADVVLRRLSYFSAYPYLRRATRTYAEERGVASFERDRFVALLRRVDEQMCAGHDTAGWLRLLQPLFALAAAADPDDRSAGVPVALLEAFFEEKKATAPLERLRAARREQGVATLSSSALEAVLAPGATPQAAGHAPEEEAPHEGAAPPASNDRAPARKEAEETAAARPRPTLRPPASGDGVSQNASSAKPSPGKKSSPEEAPPEAPPAAASETSDAGERGNVDDEAEEEEDEALPLWRRFQGAPAGPGKRREALAATDDDIGDGDDDDAFEEFEEDEEDEEDEPRPRWQQFGPGAAAKQEQRHQRQQRRSRGEAVSSASAPPGALRPLEEAVLGHAAGNRRLFVRELFGGSEEEYERVLRRLYNARSWRAATQVIARDVFRAHQVNIYGDPARSFTDAVEAGFR